MARDVVDSEVVESRDALVAWFEAGCKPDGPFRVGTEHEKIPFYRADHSPVPYGGERGIRALLEEHGAELAGSALGTQKPDRPLTPGRGRPFRSSREAIELSGAPLGGAHGTAIELDRRRPLPPGGQPSRRWLSRSDGPQMVAHRDADAEERYAIMARYMPEGRHARPDMMFRTATVLANRLSSERDMVAKCAWAQR
jgi:glutamate--cysteine ligase